MFAVLLSTHALNYTGFPGLVQVAAESKCGTIFGLIDRRTQLILWWIDVYYVVLNYMFRRYGHLQVDDF